MHFLLCVSSAHATRAKRVFSNSRFFLLCGGFVFRYFFVFMCSSKYYKSANRRALIFYYIPAATSTNIDYLSFVFYFERQTE